MACGTGSGRAEEENRMKIPAIATVFVAATGSVWAQERADTIAARQLIFG
jgi:hypothetical protein